MPLLSGSHVEKTSRESLRKLDRLKLYDEEWEEVATLIALLQVLKFPFSSFYSVCHYQNRIERGSTVRTMIKIHSPLMQCQRYIWLYQPEPLSRFIKHGYHVRKKAKYSPFAAALEAAIEKLTKHYNRN